MPTCDTCGGEIEFRYIDGRCVPIHLNGGCSAGSGYGYTWGSGAGLFRESSRGTPFVFQYTQLISYAAPNAHCPVCGEPVFFYESPFGGRVFFDELGPPWLKHPCTENDKNLAAFIRTTDRERLTARFKAAAPVELDPSLAKQTAAATPRSGVLMAGSLFLWRTRVLPASGCKWPGGASGRMVPQVPR